MVIFKKTTEKLAEKLDEESQTCNPSTWEAEAGGSQLCRPQHTSPHKKGKWD
jgi:hypothetical protein